MLSRRASKPHPSTLGDLVTLRDCHFCHEQSACHHFWQFTTPDVRRKKSVLLLAQEGGLSGGDPSDLVRALQEEVEGENAEKTVKASGEDNFLLAGGSSSDSDKDDGDDEAKKKKSMLGDGQAILQNECFCTVAPSALVWADKTDAQLYTPPKKCNAMLLERLSANWAITLHCTYQCMEHLTIAEAVSGGFLDIVGKTTEKKNEKKMVGSSSSLDDIYGDLDSDSSDSSEEVGNEEFSLSHVSSLQILTFSGGEEEETKKKSATAAFAAASAMGTTEQQTTGLALIFPRLKRLVLRDCTNLVDSAIPPLGDLLLLRSLDLSGCDRLVVLNGLQELKCLLHLNISSCVRLEAPTVFVYIAAKLPLLRELIAANLPQLEDACFISLAQKMEHLLVLDVSGSTITEQALDLAAGTPMSKSLETLIAKDCNGGAAAASSGGDDDNEAAASAAASKGSSLKGELEGLMSFPRIVTLDLSRNKGLGGDLCCNLSVMPRLTSVNLSALPIEDADMDALSGAQLLSSVSLCWCEQLTDEGLDALGQFPGLQALRLDGCVRITTSGLGHLVELKQLHTLSLYCCSMLTDSAALSIRHFPLLAELNVGRCGNLTDEFVKSLLLSGGEEEEGHEEEEGNVVPLRALKSMNLEKSKISDVSIKLISETQKGLEILHIEGCCELTAEPLLDMIRAHGQVLEYLSLLECQELAKGKLQILTESKRVNANLCVMF